MAAKDELQIARREMLILLRNGRTKSEFSHKQPTHWSPQTVRHPQTGAYFTSYGCWEYIAELLEMDHEMEAIGLEKPPGATGYVIKARANEQEPDIYIKLQIGSGWLFGRSFHYSFPEH